MKRYKCKDGASFLSLFEHPVQTLSNYKRGNSCALHKGGGKVGALL